MTRIVMAMCCMALFLSCKNTFQYNPNEVRLEEAFREVNAKNIARIQAMPRKDSLKFILIGDTQRFYDQVEDFVRHANERNDIDFAVLAGDVSDFGTAKEFQWVHERLRQLKFPYVAVIGNHDMLANGRLAYSTMYGAEDFTFSTNGTKFICLNTNSQEVGYDGSIPRMSWLEGALSDLSQYQRAYVVSHMPPNDVAFDSTLEHRYASLLRSSGKVKMAMSGHQHRYSLSEPYGDGIPYLVVGSFNKRNYALITAAGETSRTEEIYY